MGVLLHLPIVPDASQAWDAYDALVRRANADRRLWGDAEHCRAMARAHGAWFTAYMRADGAR
ncbi:hypothetical protein [Sphingomonas colocasiae]|uniref:Uncharacterized protein n=1 Tax=Sphingomonas colocasiae TaxID=1848973 RepID=A0ABS7PYQ3_9SPHN|nr:hypothetical protein [Sphingomonas colocasiae]MBY8825104.1 hypothetical protein [Sphingomonas colocasiae]